jgi:DNA-binding HxlR family transcriptional regulator
MLGKTYVCADMSASTIQEDTASKQSGYPEEGWHCPAEATLEFLSGKWRPMIIFWLLAGALRFNELQRRLGAITHRTLSKTLKEMEMEGLVARNDYGEMPPRVDYALTVRGHSLKPVLQAMEEWAQGDADAKRGDQR